MVTVGDMRVSDLRGVCAIEATLSEIPWSRRLFLEELTQGESRIYLSAKEGRKVLGYFGSMLIEDEVHVTTVAVRHEFEGRGIATRLLLEGFERAVSLGIHAATLEVRASNKRAQRLYERFGFMPVGVRPKYYQNNDEDAIIMWCYGLDETESILRRASIKEDLR